jgi:nitroreductase
VELGELEKLIKGRRSVRQWTDRPVPDDLIRRGIELATWAPNGGNFQGWHFVVVKNREVILKMAEAVQSAADRIASWPEAKAWAEDVERSRKRTSFFREAPVCIAVFVSQYQSMLDKVLNARERSDPEATQMLSFRRSAPTGIQSAAAAVATLLLVFHQMGLGAVWLGAPLMAKREIETHLNVSTNLGLVCLVAVGYANESPSKDRKPVDDVMTWVK